MSIRYLKMKRYQPTLPALSTSECALEAGERLAAKACSIMGRGCISPYKTIAPLLPLVQLNARLNPSAVWRRTDSPHVCFAPVCPVSSLTIQRRLFQRPVASSPSTAATMRLSRLLCDVPDYRRIEGGPGPEQAGASPLNMANTRVSPLGSDSPADAGLLTSIQTRSYRGRSSRRPSLVNAGSIRSTYRPKTASHDTGVPKQPRLLYLTTYHCPTCFQQLWERKVIIQRCSIPGHGLACEVTDPFAVTMELCRRTEMTDKACGLCRWLAWRAARKRWRGPERDNVKTAASGSTRTSTLSTQESRVPDFYQQDGTGEVS